MSDNTQTVLVVEDEASIASFVSLYLKNAGYDVRAVAIVERKRLESRARRERRRPLREIPEGDEAVGPGELHPRNVDRGRFGTSDACRVSSGVYLTEPASKP